LLTHPGRMVTVRHIAKLTKEPFEQSFTPTNINSGFQKTGIVPFNPMVFSDNDFAPATILTKKDSSQELVYSDFREVANDPPPSEATVTATHSRGSSTITAPIDPSPEMIRPLPSTSKDSNIKTRHRKSIDSTIYTDTPEMKKARVKAETAQEKAALKEQRERVKRAMKFDKRHKKMKNPVPSMTPNKSDDSDSIFEEVDDEEFEFLLDSDMINEGDFLLVQFPTKKTIVHFIGVVTGFFYNNEYKVKFLRKTSHSYCFSFPEVVDESSVERRDVIGRLTIATQLRGKYTFKDNLKIFNMR